MKRRRLVVAGAGGFGREVVAYAEATTEFLEKYDIREIVYIDDAAPEVPVHRSLVGTISEFVPSAGDLFLCAIGEPKVRELVTENLLLKGAQFATLVAAGAYVGPRVALGLGTIVCPGTVLTCDVVVGAHVHVNIGTMVGHDVQIDDYVTLSPSCNLMGGVKVESRAFFGTSATVIPTRTIGSRAVVGAGSLVLKSVEPGVTVMGSPAQPLRRSS